MTTHFRFVRFAPVAAGAIIAAAGLLFAGPLNPPAGPVASTYKTLAEVEPRTAINATNTPGDANSLFKITQPGSYYLTANVIGVAGRHGIEIGTGSVVLDLNGFSVISSGIGLDGVTTDGLAQVSITVRNGVVSAWGNAGLDLVGTGHLIEHVDTRVNAAGGIFVGSSAVVSNCQASGNPGIGINVGVGCTVAESSSFSNGGIGINAGFGCTITGCSATTNTGAGIDTSNDCVITDCTARGNSAGGMAVGSNCTISNSSATNNTGIGLSAGAGCTLANCSAGSNTVSGFSTSSSCTLTNCAAYLNQGDGILTSQGNTVTNCSSFNNTGNGINVQTGCTVADCSVKFNTLDGIRCTHECLIRGNNVSYAGSGAGDGAAIVAGQLNRIEANHCSRSDRGIDVNLAGNVIVRNTCAANTVNFTFVADNVYGPILNRIAPASPAVNGSVAASTLGSTDANANYAH